MAEENKKENKKEEKKEEVKKEVKTEEKKKVKRPTALKRILQSTRQNQLNRQHKSKIKTALKDYMDAIEKKENKDVSLKKLNLIFGLIDKAAKKNIFKKNKASRLKSKYSLMLNK